MFDLIVILVLAISAGLAWFRGAILELATLIALGLAWLIASQLAPILTNMSGNQGSMVALFVIFGMIMTVGFFTLYIATHIGLNAMKLSPRAQTINRFSGAIFGLLRGYALIGLAYLAISYSFSEEDQPPSLQNAMTKPLAASSARLFENLIPESTKIETAQESDTQSASIISDAGSVGYNRQDRAGLSEVIATVTTRDAGSNKRATPPSPDDSNSSPD